jgi:outer membrane immunogenic protein
MLSSTGFGILESDGVTTKSKVVVVAASLSLMGAPAIAADMPTNARMPVKAPVIAPFSWTGFYIGATAGAAWTKSDVSLDAINAVADPLYITADIPGLDALGSPSIKGTNAVFGGKLGYNQQWGAVVLGLESDLSYFHFDKTVNTSGNPFLTFAIGNANFTENVTADWLATVRPRLGYAFDRALVYVTGGLAVGKVSFSNNYVGLSLNGFGNEFESSSVSKTKAGWSVGGGVDYALTQNWILSAEYMHVDLGSVSTSGPVAQQSTPFNPVDATLNFSAKLKSDIVRAGIAYKF